MVFILEEKAMRVICVHRPQIIRSDCKNEQYYNEMACEWNLQNPSEMVLRR